MPRKVRAFAVDPKIWMTHPINGVSHTARGIYMRLLVHFYFEPAYLHRPIPFKVDGAKTARALAELVNAGICRAEAAGVVILDQCGSRFIRKPITDTARNRIFARDSYQCRSCGTGKNLTVDHILSVHKGGLNYDDNLQTLCRSCNGKKGF